MILMSLFFCVLFSLFYDSFFTLGLLLVLIGLLLCTGSSAFAGFFFIDGVSFVLVFLSLLILMYCVFSSLLDYWQTNFFGVFNLTLSTMFLMVLISFTCFSITLFYFSFEFMFLMMFIFLLNWGYSPERLQASFYMVFYTMVVSFPFLIYIALSKEASAFGLFLQLEYYWWVFFLLVFLVKLPVYGAHLWLPKAHVEAPVAGSMLLAGVLLKLGGYGLIRLSPMFSMHLSQHSGYLISLGLLGGFTSCFLCLRQSDLKSFVAYSSVCHMGFGLAGLFAGSALGTLGGLMMLIAHGYCSSCLFYMLYVLYDRTYSRSLLILKGLATSLPLMSGLWFLFVVLNMGVPPFFSFFSEILILSSVSASNLTTFLFSGSILFMAGLYCVFLYVLCFHGKGEAPNGFYMLSTREYTNMFSHAFYLLFSIFLLFYFF